MPELESRTSSDHRLLVRAIGAFVLLPGMVAFVVPAFLLAPRAAAFVDGRGVLPLGVGTVLLLWCVREFYVAGRGTLAPWSPPRELVMTGPYQYSRNPMYVAVMLILVGWTIGFRLRSLAVYAIAVGIAFHLRVVLYEEPRLAQAFGSGWQHYRAQVRRWLGRR